MRLIRNDRLHVAGLQMMQIVEVDVETTSCDQHQIRKARFDTSPNLWCLMFSQHKYLPAQFLFAMKSSTCLEAAKQENSWIPKNSWSMLQHEARLLHWCLMYISWRREKAMSNRRLPPLQAAVTVPANPTSRKGSHPHEGGKTALSSGQVRKPTKVALSSLQGKFWVSGASKQLCSSIRSYAALWKSSEHPLLLVDAWVFVPLGQTDKAPALWFCFRLHVMSGCAVVPGVTGPHSDQDHGPMAECNPKISGSFFPPAGTTFCRVGIFSKIIWDPTPTHCRSGLTSVLSMWRLGLVVGLRKTSNHPLSKKIYRAGSDSRGKWGLDEKENIIPEMSHRFSVCLSEHCGSFRTWVRPSVANLCFALGNS